MTHTEYQNGLAQDLATSTQYQKMNARGRVVLCFIPICNPLAFQHYFRWFFSHPMINILVLKHIFPCPFEGNNALFKLCNDQHKHRHDSASNNFRGFTSKNLHTSPNNTKQTQSIRHPHKLSREKEWRKI